MKVEPGTQQTGPTDQTSREPSEPRQTWEDDPDEEQPGDDELEPL